MKKAFPMSLLFIGISGFAQADTLPAVKNVSVEVFAEAPGDAGGPPVPAHSQINVTVHSCAPRALRVEAKKSKDGLVKLRVLDSAIADCRSTGIDRVYTLEVNSGFKSESYVLLNPLAATYR